MTDEKALEMEAKKELERGKEEAEKLLNNKDKLTEVLLEVEEKSKSLPLVGELISRVASKGGTTQKALDKLDEASFDDIITSAMVACTARAEELGKQ